MVTITEYNPFAPEVKENPYPYYAWLRREHPVYYHPRLDFWVLSRYADVAAAGRDHETFSSAQGIGPDRMPLPTMITTDPPDHTRLRKLVSKAFTPRMIEQSAPRIQATVDALLDAVMAQGRFDLMQALAFPLPVIVIAEMLGVEPERREDFKRWSQDVIGITAGVAHGHDQAQYLRSWEEFKAYVSETIAMRRRAPRDDLITALVKAQDEREALIRSEILNFILLLLVAGNETTTNLIGNGVLALFTHPEQGQKLRQRPELVPSMVEEVLRYDSPIQSVFRTTTRAVEMHGTTIPADSKVALLWGAANRDPAEFPTPDCFDIERMPNRHMAFGMGIHFCLGAPLARLEGRLTIETLLRRMPHLSPDPHGTLVRVDNPQFRGLKHFPLVFEPAR
jgi:cytochrome P450